MADVGCLMCTQDNREPAVSRALLSEPRQVQAAIDRLLMEQGEVTPVEVLLATGALAYRDYEAWREGRVPFLEDVLQCSPEEVRGLLQEVGARALAHGLRAEEHSYSQWAGQQPLRCSPGAEEPLFLTRYRPPSDRMQLDLFFDSREAVLVNGLRSALAARNTGEATRLLGELRRALPGHRQTGLFECLLAAQAEVGAPVGDPAAELERLQTSIEPAAQDALGPEARDFVVPHWRRLAGALPGRPFDPERPELHASFAAARAEDWDAARRAVEAELDWRSEPVLIQRHAAAWERLGDRQAALADWCLLCWDFPASAPDRLPESGLLGAAWTDFQDLEPPLDTPDFPAWLVLRGAGPFAPPPEAANAAARETFECIQWLVAQSAAAPDHGVLAARRALRARHPGLFDLYMAAVQQAQKPVAAKALARDPPRSPPSRD
jgi:hypothetical protein